MKYAFILSIVSLVLYHDNVLSAAGAAGYLSAIFFLVTYREKPAMLAIACIAAAIITIMYFSLAGYMHIGIAWSMTITAFTAILTLVSLVYKIKNR